MPHAKFKEIYKITSGHPLLLEIIGTYKRTRKYIYEEIFSKFSKEEHKILEIISIYRIPIPYDAFFIERTASANTIEGLVHKSVIKETGEGFYDSHEFIKEFFYVIDN